MEIDTSLGYDYWINTLASIMDNPIDSIHNKDEAADAISDAFNIHELTVYGSAIDMLLDKPKEGKWEIVS